MRWPKKIYAAGETWERGNSFSVPYGGYGFVYEHPGYLPIHIPPSLVEDEEDLRDWILTMRTPVHH